MFWKAGVASVPSLDASRQKRARSLARARLLSGALEFVVLLGLLLVFWYFSPRLTALLPTNLVAAAVAYFFVLAFSLAILDFPLAYYREFVLPHRFGLSEQKFGDWLADSLKMGLPSLLLLGGLVGVAYFFILESSGWWLFMWLSLLLLSLLLNLALPGLILPRLYKLEPLGDGDLKDRLLLLPKKAAREVKDIYVIKLSEKGTASNAALVGIGRTKKIVLGDNLLRSYSPEEIEVILAHELGHDANSDSYRLLIFQALFFLAVFYLTSLLWGAFGPVSLDSPESLPGLLILVSVIVVALTPLFNFYSRRLEERADRYALELTDNPDAFIGMMARLTDQNLLPASPSSLVETVFSDHPSYSSRVAVAEKYRLGRSS